MSLYQLVCWSVPLLFVPEYHLWISVAFSHQHLPSGACIPFWIRPSPFQPQHPPPRWPLWNCMSLCTIFSKMFGIEFEITQENLIKTTRDWRTRQPLLGDLFESDPVPRGVLVSHAAILHRFQFIQLGTWKWKKVTTRSEPHVAPDFFGDTARVSPSHFERTWARFQRNRFLLHLDDEC